MDAPPEDVQATYAATLVDEWVRRGVRVAVVAPGSRSTPLALALVAHPAMRVEVHLDERSAAFLALGIAIGSGAPSLVVTTSGTATAELHAAVVEADLARVPLIVCTADRPPELRDVGAPQAIDQDHLFGRAVRWFHAPGLADAGSAGRWRGIAARTVAAATGSAAGPVHLNLAFREPLVGRAGMLPEAPADRSTRLGQRPSNALTTGPALTLVDDLVGKRGVIVAGPGSGPGRAVDDVARALGWPVLAAPQAPVWGIEGAVVPCADALLRSDWLAAALRPEVVVRLGMPLASKEIGRWIAESGADEIVVAGPDRWVDPAGTASLVLPIEPAELLAGWATGCGDADAVAGGDWLAAWREAGATASAAVEAVLDAEPHPSEPGIARGVVAALLPGTELVVSSSMPIRDVEWYAPSRSGIRVHANRGANGIDGVVSTAVGIAAGTGHPTVLLTGDLAFLHDSNGLLGTAARSVDLTVVVVDNDGGGIFSFLPQASALGAAEFETLFGTPHGLDLTALGTAYGVPAEVTDDVRRAVPAALAEGGLRILVARTDRGGNVAAHDRLHRAVAAALRGQ